MTDDLYKLISSLGQLFRINAIPRLPPERQREEWLLLYREGYISPIVIEGLPEPQCTEAILSELRKTSTPEYINWSGGYNDAIAWAKMLPEPQRSAHLSDLVNRMVDDRRFESAIKAMRCLQPAEQEQFMIRIIDIHKKWMESSSDSKNVLERIGGLLKQYYA